MPQQSDCIVPSDFDAQYKRLFEAAGCRTQGELAALLGVRQSSISDAKRRKNIPSEWFLKLFEKSGINPVWIRTGTGSKVFTIEHRPIQDCTSDELLTELVRRALKHIA